MNNYNFDDADGIEFSGAFAQKVGGSPVTESSWMVGLREGIIDFTNAYHVFDSKMNTDDKPSRTFFALSLTTLTIRNNKAVDAYLEALNKGECVSILDNYFWKLVAGLPRLENSKLENILLNDIIPLEDLYLEISLSGRKLLDTQDVYHLLKEGYADLKRKLKEAKVKLANVGSKFYENLYEREKARFDLEHVDNEFYDQELKHSTISFQNLKRFQTCKVFLFLLKGGLRHDDKPSTEDVSLVKEELVKNDLSHDFKYPDDFKDLCARIIPYRIWQGSRFYLKKAELGCYLHRFYYQMTEAERQAIFELEVMMNLINEKMMKDFPEKTNDSEQEDNTDEKTVDRRIKSTVETMKSEGVIVHLYDYTWIMVLMNQTDELPSFDSPQSFLTYLASLGISPLPDQSSIIKEFGRILGVFPNWIFPKKDKTESDRRVNVGKRFLNLYRHAE